MSLFTNPYVQKLYGVVFVCGTKIVNVFLSVRLKRGHKRP